MQIRQSEERNIILTGFMGTGKTSIGRLMAKRLRREFVDMDAVIEERTGRSIPQIFQEQGEEAFRAMERELCRELAARSGLVIATGGGALVSAENRALLGATGDIICLRASPDVIMARVGASANRPKLDGTDRRARIEALLDERAAAYNSIQLQLDTSELTLAEAVERALALLWGLTEARRLPVHAPGDHSYDIVLGEGILSRAGELLARRLAPSPVAIITHPVIGQHWAGLLTRALEAAGFCPTVVEIPAGEEHKTLDTVRFLYHRLLAAGLDRRSAVIALGGGVVGDIAGFVAATFLRGVPFVQIPTTLLSMVDASVGGKVGVDLPEGKNLVGAFKQPEMVLMDPLTLSTLPSEEFRAGLAEVVKHSVIGAPELFRQMEERTGPTSLTALIADAVRVKIEVVEEDPFEQGRRAVLNLGHTFGHALEQLSGYRMRHGEAVSIGMAAAARLAVHLGRCEVQTANRLIDLLDRLGLPVRIEGYSAEALYQAMGTDKKRAAGQLRFVIPEEIGRVVIADGVSREQAISALRAVGAS
ncbi:MAG: 3-dehydroquinate synthase [Anaerolineae bacterium]|nr:3-dehydroquinate synthase [Anaerolineae bacterium]MDW8099866.1 3-dehydroquinate synthase [Anaerolineae bacterium]